MQEGGGGKEQNQHHDGVRKYRQLVQQHPLEDMIDLHILMIPPFSWRKDLRYAYSVSCTQSVSLGFIRVLPQSTLVELRYNITLQLDPHLIPPQFVLLRKLGLHLTWVGLFSAERLQLEVNERQEKTLPIRLFAPPLTPYPEVYILDKQYLTDNIALFRPLTSDISFSSVLQSSDLSDSNFQQTISPENKEEKSNHTTSNKHANSSTPFNTHPRSIQSPKQKTKSRQELTSPRNTMALHNYSSEVQPLEKHSFHQRTLSRQLSSPKNKYNSEVQALEMHLISHENSVNHWPQTFNPVNAQDGPSVIPSQSMGQPYPMNNQLNAQGGPSVIPSQSMGQQYPMNNQLNAQGGPSVIPSQSMGQQYPMNNQLNAQGGPSVIPSQSMGQQYPMNNQLNAQGGPSVIPSQSMGQPYPMNNQLNAQGGPSVIPSQSMGQQYPMNNQLNAQGGPSVIPSQSMGQQYPMNNQLNAQGGPSVISSQSMGQQYPMNNQLNAQGGPSVIPTIQQYPMNNQLNTQGGPPTIQQYPMNNQLNTQGGPPTIQQYPMNNQLNAQGGPSVIPTNQQYPMNNQLNAQGGPSVIPLQSMDQQYSMNNQSQSSMANPLYELNASPSIIPQSLNQQYKPTNNSRFPSNEKYNMSHMRQVTDYGNEDVTFDKIPLNKETFDNNLPRVPIDNSIILHNATNGYFESEITTANPDESDSFKHGHLFSHNAPPKKEFKNPVMFNTVQQQPNEIHVTNAREPPPNNRPFNMGNAANGMTLIGEVVTSASNNISGLPYDELMSKSSELGYMRDSAHQPNVDDATSHSLAFDELSEHLQIKNFQSKPDTTLDNMPHMKKNKAVTFDDRSIEDSISSITEQNQEEIQAVVNYSNGPDLPNNGQLVREPSDKLENIEQHENLNENKSKNNNKVLKADIVQSNNTGKRLSQKELPQQVARKEAQILGQSTGYLTATESPVTNLQSNEEIKLSKLDSNTYKRNPTSTRDTDGSEYEKYVRLAESNSTKEDQQRINEAKLGLDVKSSTGRGSIRMTENEEITASLAIDSSPNEYSTGNDVGSTINQEEPIENKETLKIMNQLKEIKEECEILKATRDNLASNLRKEQLISKNKKGSIEQDWKKKYLLERQKGEKFEQDIITTRKSIDDLLSLIKDKYNESGFSRKKPSIINNLKYQRYWLMNDTVNLRKRLEVVRQKLKIEKKAKQMAAREQYKLKQQLVDKQIQLSISHRLLYETMKNSF